MMLSQKMLHAIKRGEESKQDDDDKTHGGETKEMPEIFSRFFTACSDADAKKARKKTEQSVFLLTQLCRFKPSWRYKLDEWSCEMTRELRNDILIVFHRSSVSWLMKHEENVTHC